MYPIEARFDGVLFCPPLHFFAKASQMREKFENCRIFPEECEDFFSCIVETFHIVYYTYYN